MFSGYKFFTSSARIIPRCFILFDATVNGIVFLIFLSDSYLLVYRNATEPTQFKPVLFKGQLYLLYVLGALMWAAYIFIIVIPSCWIDSFIIMKCPSLSPVTLFVLFFLSLFLKIYFIYLF